MTPRNDVLWAIRPSVLAQDSLSAKGNNPPKSASGTAVIPITGIIEREQSLFGALFGGTSSKEVQAQIVAAVNDPKVRDIVLYVDSPGGEVTGTKELSDLIFASRGKKPITAFTDGMMASAAYWIASAAGKVYMTPSAMAGSIGVVMTHTDHSAADAQEGLKRTDIFAGKYKRIASSNAPLSDDGRAYLQAMVDSAYETFLTDVARNRGVSMEQALAMADGREFFGKDALSVGLVDAIEPHFTLNPRGGFMSILDKIRTSLAGNSQPAEPEPKTPDVAGSFEVLGKAIDDQNGKLDALMSYKDALVEENNKLNAKIAELESALAKTNETLAALAKQTIVASQTTPNQPEVKPRSVEEAWK